MASGNTFGNLLKITTFGESHSSAIGGVLDGVPSNIAIDLNFVQSQLNRRKPGQSSIVSQRKEDDLVNIISGIFDGKTTGTPIGFIIENKNQKSQDYSHLKDNFRPSHADFTYQSKYKIRDYRGGGRSSARETASRVVAGAIAMQIIPFIKITAFVSSVGEISLNKNYTELDLSTVDSNPVRCPDPQVASQMEEYIKQVRKNGDSVGGVITCVAQNVPVGLGEPVFARLDAALAAAMLSINASKGFEYGSGFNGTKMLGSQHNDLFNSDFSTKTNYSGGIQGGISNGMDIYFRVAFKPVATLMMPQHSYDVNSKQVTILGKGRHDPCVLPRAVPIVEAMTALVLADFYLMNKVYS